MSFDLKKYIDIIEDFPKEGISFKDVSPILLNPDAMNYCIKEMAKIAKELKPTVIVGPEARGFVFGCPLAYELNLPFVMARKDGKLPNKVINFKYNTEYSTTSINIHANALKEGDRVLLVDDLLATGGTLQAISSLVKSQKADVCGVLTVVELTKVRQKELLKDVEIRSLVKYEY